MKAEPQSTEQVEGDSPGVHGPGCGALSVMAAAGLLAMVAIMVGWWATTSDLAEGRSLGEGRLLAVGALSGVLFVVGGVLVRRGRAWGDPLSLAALLGLLLGGAFVLAQPGARHPLAMSVVGAFAVGFGVAPVLRLSKRPTLSRSALAIVAWSVLCGLLAVIGSSELPMAMRLRLAQDAMDEHAQAVLATPQVGAEYSDCNESHHIGPYRYGFCSEGSEGGGWVEFYLLDPPGYGYDGGAGLLYAPGGVPEVALSRCANHLSGDWYETYWPRGVNGCSWGLER